MTLEDNLPDLCPGCDDPFCRECDPTCEDPTMTNFDRFIDAYASHLRHCVTELPGQYTYGIDKVPAVVGRVADAIRRRSYNKDGLAFKRTCKQLGIKHTYKAIAEFIDTDKGTTP